MQQARAALFAGSRHGMNSEHFYASLAPTMHSRDEVPAWNHCSSSFFARAVVENAFRYAFGKCLWRSDGLAPRVEFEICKLSMCVGAFSASLQRANLLFRKAHELIMSIRKFY
jgi:hypothetical protein